MLKCANASCSINMTSIGSLGLPASSRSLSRNSLKAAGLRSADNEVDTLWTSRIVGGRIRINPAHDDFPAMLAEALDWIENSEFDLKAASDKLDCTGSQLTKFLKREPRAMSGVNANRKSRGLHPLK